MSKVQTYQNVASKVLQVILAIAAKHICKSKKYTYKLIKTIRNNACVIYVNTKLNLVYCFTLHNFTIAKRWNPYIEPKSNQFIKTLDIILNYW